MIINKHNWNTTANCCSLSSWALHDHLAAVPGNSAPRGKGLASTNKMPLSVRSPSTLGEARRWVKPSSPTEQAVGAVECEAKIACLARRANEADATAGVAPFACWVAVTTLAEVVACRTGSCGGRRTVTALGTSLTVAEGTAAAPSRLEPSSRHPAGCRKHKLLWQ